MGECIWAAKGDSYFPASPLLLLNISNLTTCALPKNCTESARRFPSSLRTERTHSRQRMRRERPMVACGSAGTPPRCTVSLRLQTQSRETVTEGGDEDRKSNRRRQALKLPGDKEDDHTVTLTGNTSVLPPGSESPSPTCTPRHLGDSRIPDLILVSQAPGPEQSGPQGDGSA